MNSPINPELEQIIPARIQLEQLTASDQAMDLAVQPLEEVPGFERQWMAETRQKLASASAQIERGEVLDGLTVIAGLQAKLNQARETA
jgi:antitoxin ParD1/3/4